jgi:hypothetical protein
LGQKNEQSSIDGCTTEIRDAEKTQELYRDWFIAAEIKRSMSNGRDGHYRPKQIPRWQVRSALFFVREAAKAVASL